MNFMMWYVVIIRFFDVSKFTSPTPLSLLVASKLSFLTVGLKMCDIIPPHSNMDGKCA